MTEKCYPHGHGEQDHQFLHVIVHYIATARPFKDEHADRRETVGHLKTRVIAAFGLIEGDQNDGGTATYTLFHGKVLLENMSETLGCVAGEHKELNLKLSQELIQGNLS